jgi:hypothetical protein
MTTTGKSDAVSAEFRRKRFAQQAARTALLLQETWPLSRQPPDAYSLVMRYCMKIAQARSCLLLQHSLLAAYAPVLLPAEQAFPSASFR